MSTRAERDHYAGRVKPQLESRREIRNRERIKRGLPPYRGWRYNFDDPQFNLTLGIVIGIALAILNSCALHLDFWWVIYAAVIVTVAIVYGVRWDEERRAARSEQLDDRSSLG